MTQPIHFCHWPGCRERVPPKLYACRAHWFSLPLHIRRAIVRAYVPGQEVTKTPSAEYIAAAKAAQEWIKKRTPAPLFEPAKPFAEPGSDSEL